MDCACPHSAGACCQRLEYLIPCPLVIHWPDLRSLSDCTARSRQVLGREAA